MLAVGAWEPGSGVAAEGPGRHLSEAGPGLKPPVGRFGVLTPSPCCQSEESLPGEAQAREQVPTGWPPGSAWPGPSGAGGCGGRGRGLGGVGPHLGLEGAQTPLQALSPPPTSVRARTHRSGLAGSRGLRGGASAPRARIEEAGLQGVEGRAGAGAGGQPGVGTVQQALAAALFGAVLHALQMQVAHHVGARGAGRLRGAPRRSPTRGGGGARAAPRTCR